MTLTLNIYVRTRTHAARPTRSLALILVSVAVLAATACATPRTSWVPTPVPDPGLPGPPAFDSEVPGPPLAHLIDVSCTSRTFCMAVGAVGRADRSYDSLISRWDGRSWTNTHATDGAALFDVSCPSATFCVAAVMPGTPAGPSVRVWDGATWSNRTLPTTSASPWLGAVDCPTTTWCVATGSDNYEWDGSTWRLTSPGNPYSLRLRVSCAAPERCVSSLWAFTSQVESGPSGFWTGDGWGEPTSFVPRTDPAVSCTPADGRCVGVGIEYGEDGVLTTVTVTGDGSSWTEADRTSLAGIDVVDLSCVRSDDCVAAGILRTGSVTHPTTYFWNGKTWRAGVTMTVPALTADPPVQGTRNLSHFSSGLSCVATWCMRVGGSATERPMPGSGLGDLAGRPLAETLQR